MDRKGQSTVIFIILIPVFIIITTLIVDTGINMYNEKKLKNVTEDVLTNLLESDLSEDKYYNRAKNIYETNDIDTDFLSINVTYDNRIELYNSTIYYSFLGTLLNRGNHQTVVEAEGYKNENGEIVIKFIKDDIYEN